jgi:predicted nucleotidyltransferase/HEPN domain-containing protein
LRSDLDHLPLRKQDELRRALKVIFEGFEQALTGKLSDRRKTGRILKVILYGSHARGDWVADPKGGYVSDYDLLVVVDNERFTDFEYWTGIEATFLQRSMHSPLKASPSLIVHSLMEVNDHLARGRYFFMDVLREGIVLYEAEGFPFVEPQPLTPEAAREEREIYFKHWFERASRRFELGQEALSRGYLNEAAFDFHQVTERLYCCTLLVLTLYAPKLHDIETLRDKWCEPLDRRLAEAWPRGTRRERRFFQKLRRAYVDARYSKHYTINLEELTWLSERIAILQDIVKRLCEECLAQDPTR